MVGGYILVEVPTALAKPDFEPGTVVPGIYETLSVVFSTGKIPVCQFDGPFDYGGVTTSFIANLTKTSNDQFIFSAMNASFVVNADDTVVIN